MGEKMEQIEELEGPDRIVTEALINKVNGALAKKFKMVLLRDSRPPEPVEDGFRDVPWFHCTPPISPG